MILLALAAGGALWAGGGRLDIGKLRRDYIALRYLQDATTAVTQQPMDRALAVRRLTRALELAPEAAIIAAAAPELFIAAGDYARALRELNRRGSRDPYLTGLCLLKLGQTGTGAQLVLRASRLAGELHALGRLDDRQYAMQLNNVGYVLADAGVQLDQAREMLRTATNILPLDPNCIDSLGWLYYRLGDSHRAVFYLERAARLHTGRPEPDVCYHLGAAYARDGRHGRAAKLLRLALRLDPSHEEARRELDRLNWLLPQLTLARVIPARLPARSRPAWASRDHDA